MGRSTKRMLFGCKQKTSTCFLSYKNSNDDLLQIFLMVSGSNFRRKMSMHKCNKWNDRHKKATNLSLGACTNILHSRNLLEISEILNF